MSIQTTRRPFTITCVRRDDDGHWTAHVTGEDGKPIAVDRSSGSWHASKSGRVVLPRVAAALQERVRPTERAEAAERKRAEGATKVGRLL